MLLTCFLKVRPDKKIWKQAVFGEWPQQIQHWIREGRGMDWVRSTRGCCFTILCFTFWKLSVLQRCQREPMAREENQNVFKATAIPESVCNGCCLGHAWENQCVLANFCCCKLCSSQSHLGERKPWLRKCLHQMDLQARLWGHFLVSGRAQVTAAVPPCKGRSGLCNKAGWANHGASQYAVFLCGCCQCSCLSSCDHFLQRWTLIGT